MKFVVCSLLASQYNSNPPHMCEFIHEKFDGGILKGNPLVFDSISSVYQVINSKKLVKKQLIEGLRK
ncbi:hypothetical protein Y032_0009g795 [Ancylostoma ceylanicum]|uniref:Uncharacterized protein n=1 Tax=Ancylostoma ceylanicum TaxID=53326 RepID=A0A016VLE9_9BILA|nr:hypothetical protein Y032_0009g795 [Ancylostoma ceylanicum]